MEQWIHFARGPLFAFAFLVMVLGLARLLIVQVYSIVKGKGRRLRRVPWRRIAAEAATWVVPVRHLIPGTAAFSVVSYLFHIGILTTPVFLANHVVLWEGFLGVKLPRIGYLLGDLLTLSTIGCLLALLGFRICSRRLRSMSKRSDYVLLVAILVPFASGYMAMHCCPGDEFRASANHLKSG